MRFMMLMIPRGYESAQPGTMPSADAVAAMMKYNRNCRKRACCSRSTGCIHRRWARASRSKAASRA